MSLTDYLNVLSIILNYLKWESQLRNLATQLETKAWTNSSKLFTLLLLTLPEIVGKCDYLGLMKVNNVDH